MKKSLEAPPEPASGGFENFGLDPTLLSAIKRLKFHTPSDIQTALIPEALKGRDCLGQARTGTGKTAAFALPMLQTLEVNGGFQALVLVPTRELAKQVDEHVRMLGADHPMKVALVYGGRRISEQSHQLERDPEIIIGTPGRVLDLIRRRIINITKLKLVVLDEVDRMLDIGFRDDIRRILNGVKTKHQTIFVSATIDDEIRTLARTFMHDPVELNVSEDRLTVEEVDQAYISVHPENKFKSLLNFIKQESPKLAIVFTNTKHMARKLAGRLQRADVNCKEIHGDLMQSRRERVMRAFRESHIHVLVATDLASRGLDVLNISHIINYDIPADPSIYVHRIGRTARMGRDGHAITFATPEDGKWLTEIEKLINVQLRLIEDPWVVKTDPPAREPDKKPEPEPAAPSRMQDTVWRDDELAKRGAKAPPRTLGSRFPTTRRRRKLR